jgi:hypothetical protein
MTAFFVGKAIIGDPYPIKKILETILFAKWGSGAYFSTALLLSLFLFPFMYKLIEKKGFWGIVIICAISLASDIIFINIPFGEDIQRILPIRFSHHLALGIYFYIKKGNISLWKTLPFALAGFAFSTGYCLLGYEPIIFKFSPYHSLSVAGSYFFTFVIIYKLFKNLTPKTIIGRFVCLAGQSSYHIMFTQILLFLIIPTGFRVFPVQILDNLWMVAICVVTGIVFYKTETKITGFFINKIFKKA